jgi:hypothetical protein
LEQQLRRGGHSSKPTAPTDLLSRNRECNAMALTNTNRVLIQAADLGSISRRICTRRITSARSNMPPARPWNCAFGRLDVGPPLSDGFVGRPHVRKYADRIAWTGITFARQRAKSDAKPLVRLASFFPGRRLDILSSYPQIRCGPNNRGGGECAEAPEGVKIRRLAASASVDILFTCDEKLRKHEIWRPDALFALKPRSVVKSERHGLEWRRTIRGDDRDEGEIFLVITVDQEHRLIVVLDGWR